MKVDASGPYRSVLFINQHYHPDVAASGQRLTDLAEALVTRGYVVSVLCGRGGYFGESGRAAKKETVNGVQVVRVSGTNFGRKTHLGRLVDYATFLFLVLVRLAVGKKHDVVVALTTPPLLPSLCALLSSVTGRPYGIWSMDLHPDAEIALGMLEEDSLFGRALVRFNNFGYRNATFVVDLGRHMQERILRKGVSPGRAHTIPIWARGAEYVPEGENRLLDAWGLRGRFVVLYAGNAGLVHRFEEVLGAMERLKDDPRIYFLFVGGGPRMEEITGFARERGVGNFQFRTYVRPEQLPELLSAGHVHLMSLRSDMSGIAVPSKLYDCLAVGRPVVMVGPEASDSAETILDGNCGFVVDPEIHGAHTIERIAEAFLRLSTNRQLWSRLGQNALTTFEMKHERQVLCDQWANLLSDTPPVGSEQIAVPGPSE